MNEEEIIKIIKYMLENKNTDINVIINYEAIQGLLDLYEKEKEKNKELIKDKKAFTDNYGNMLLKIVELEKENHEIKQWKYTIDTIEDLDRLKELDLIKIKGKEFISKDKIRNLILKYRCFDWHNKDDEYWANRILDGFEQCLKEE